MTEQDFLSSTDLTQLVNYLVGRVSERKLRLWACAVARLFWEHMTEPVSRQAVETSERYADGEASLEELQVAGREARTVRGVLEEPGYIRAYQSCDHDPWLHVVNLWSYTIPGERIALLREIVGNPFQPVTLRRVREYHLAGVPCFEMDWQAPFLTSSILHMAQTIYQERDFSALPMLADLLEENGCGEEILLHHFRDQVLCPACSQGDPIEKWYGGGGGWCAYCDQSGPDLHWIPSDQLLPEHKHFHSSHVVGCWALDILTGRK